MALAIQHAQSVYQEATKDQGPDVTESKPLRILQQRIRFHQQLLDAYTILYNYECSSYGNNVSVVATQSKNMEGQEEVEVFQQQHYNRQNVNTKTILSASTRWALEASSWISTYEMTTSESLDANVVKMKEQEKPHMTLSEFAKSVASIKHVKENPTAAQGTSGYYQIYWSDSSKTRKEALRHVFSPLHSDIFHYAVVNDILSKLGLMQDLDYLQRCFGEWMMGTELHHPSYNDALSGDVINEQQKPQNQQQQQQSSMKRWIQDMVGRDVDALLEKILEEENQKPIDDNISENQNETGQDGDVAISQQQEGAGEEKRKGPPILVLKALYDFVRESSDLVRAFVLATVCREAIAVVVKKREIKTYGRVWTSEVIEPWDRLLRKLRVCLLIRLRLHNMPLGSFPITVKHVEDPEIFSIHEWVARDELAMSHLHEEIVSLEKATAISSVVLDPSNEAADEQWQMIQHACLSSAVSDQERAEYLVGMEVNLQGALLLYLSNHNNPPILVAHRALLIAQMWLETPKRLELMRNCIDALFALEETGEYAVLAGAIRLEVWQTCIRPVFRAHLFGFDNVPEIQQSLYAPLLETPGWLGSLGKAGLSILTLIARVEYCQDRTLKMPEDRSVGRGWPPIREDLILMRIISQYRQTHINAIDAHRVVVAGCVVSTDLETLCQCIVGFYECFDTHALFDATSLSPDGDAGKQLVFLEQSIIERALAFQKPILERFDIDEIETLSLLWSIDVRDVRTIFLLAMYELAKDTVVDDMLTKVSSQRGMDMERFIEDGLGIVCHRLNYLLHIKRTPETRKILGMLDADTCEWIRDQAETTASLLDSDNGETDRMVLDVPIQLTHIFVMRLLSLASAAGSEKETRLKIHSVSVLSGTIQNEL